MRSRSVAVGITIVFRVLAMLDSCISTFKFSAKFRILHLILSRAEWRTHWRKRLSLWLAKGHATLVLGAVETRVETARCNADNGSNAVKASLEWTETGCRPGVV